MAKHDVFSCVWQTTDVLSEKKHDCTYCSYGKESVCFQHKHFDQTKLNLLQIYYRENQRDSLTDFHVWYCDSSFVFTNRFTETCFLTVFDHIRCKTESPPCLTCENLVWCTCHCFWRLWLSPPRQLSLKRDHTVDIILPSDK